MTINDNLMTNTDRSGRMILIADFLFADISRKRADVLKEFGDRFGCTDRTMSRLISAARTYNRERVNEQEAAKMAILKKSAEQQIGKDIADREEILITLTKIVRGVGRKVDGDVYIPNDSDRIKAAQQIAKMQGYEPIQKNDINQMLLQINMGLSDSPVDIETDDPIEIETVQIDE